MGTSCIGKQRKQELKKAENKSNTLSSEMHSHEEIELHKPKPNILILPLRYYQPTLNPITASFPSICFRTGNNVTSVLTNIPQSKHNHQQSTKKWHPCTTLERQWWAKRGETAVINGNSMIRIVQSTLAQINANKNEPLHQERSEIKEMLEEGQFSSVPSRIMILKVQILEQKVKNANYRLFQITSQDQINQIAQEISSVHPYSHHFATPFMSGVIFQQKKTILNNQFYLNRLLRLQEKLPSQFHLLLHQNKSMKMVKANQKLNNCRLSSYCQFSKWIQQLYGSVWDIDLQFFERHSEINQFNGYLAVQFLRCVIDSQECYFYKINDHQFDFAPKRHQIINDFIVMDMNIMPSLYFLAATFLLLHGYPIAQIQTKITLIFHSILLQPLTVTEGIFLQFGLQINEKEHPFRNQSLCFLKNKTVTNKPIKFIKKQIINPSSKLIIKIHSIFQYISSNHHSITALAVHELQQTLVSEIQPFLLNECSNTWLSRIDKAFYEDSLVRMQLMHYYIGMVNGQMNDTTWKRIMEQVSKLQLVSPQMMLMFFTLAAITASALKTTVERTASEQFYYLKALQMAHRLYGDPRCNRNSIPVQPQQIWQAIILQNFCPLYSKLPIDKREYHYLNNILECLKEDLKGILPNAGSLDNNEEVYRNNLRSMIQFMPARRISGYFFKRSQVWDLDREDSKSNFSDSQSSSGSKKTSKTSYKINEWEFTLKLNTFAGVIRWGSNIAGLPHVLPSLKNTQVLCLSSGNYHFIYLTEEGIFGWGQNHSGQLGTHNEQPIYLKQTVCLKRMQIDKSKDQFQISCGNQHTAVLFNHTLFMWGQTEGGILAGDGSTFDLVACGGLHTLAIRDGLVYSWGRGQGGQLGHPMTSLKQKKKEETTQYFVDSPQQIKGINSYAVKIACGDAHSLVLTSQGKVYVFGFCYQGQLGLGMTGENQSFQVFEPIEQGFFKERVIDVWAGPTFSFFKTQRKQVFSCGMNDCLQLGIDRVMKIFQKKKYLHRTLDNNRKRLGEQQFSKPRKIDMFNEEVKLDLVQLECGENHCLAMVEYMGHERLIMGWGLNKQYQIDSQLNENTTPRTLDALFSLPIAQLCCGSTCSLANLGSHEVTVNDARTLLQECLCQVGRGWSVQLIDV